MVKVASKAAKVLEVANNVKENLLVIKQATKLDMFAEVSADEVRALQFCEYSTRVFIVHILTAW